MAEDSRTASAPGAGPELPEGEGGEAQATTLATESRQALGEDEPRSLGGRVLPPAGISLEPKLRVTARITTAAGAGGELEAPVAEDGDFRLALPLGASTAALDLRGDFLYLEEPVQVELSDPPEDLVLEAQLGARLLVRLVPPRAADVADLVGTEVWLFYPRRPGDRQGSVDARGEVRFESLPPERADILTKPRGYAHVLWNDEVVQLQAGRELEHELRLLPEARLRGRVVDEDGRGVAHAALAMTLSTEHSTYKSFAGHTDEQGLFDVRGLQAGSVSLIVMPISHLEEILDLGALRPGDVRESLEIVVRGGRRIRGRVTWADGSPAVRIPTEARSQAPHSSSFKHAVTAADGSFTIGGLGAGAHTVLATGVELAPGERPGAAASPSDSAAKPPPRAYLENVVPDGPEILLVLSAGETLRGQVLDEHGEPFEQAQVSARRVGPSSPFTSALAQVRDPGGAFELDGLVPGTYELFAAAGAGPGERVVIDLPQGDAAVALTAPRGGALVGQVIAPAGPVAGAEVTITLSPAHRARFAGAPHFAANLSRKVISDGSGAFEVRSIALGTHTVVAQRRGAGRSRALEVELHAAAPEQELVLELLPLGWIEGELAPELGRLGDRSVAIRGGPDDSNRSASTNDRGSFEAHGLLAGTYTVAVTGFAGDARPSVALAEVTAGRATHVVLTGDHGEIRLHGSVTGGGEPMVDLALRVRSHDYRDLDAATRTDAAGRYELGLPGPGSFRFVLGEEGVGVRQQRVVPPGDEVTLDFALPGGAIGGRLLDHGGSPAAHARLMLILGGGSPPRQGRADAAGRFAFEHLDSGTYVLEAGGSSRVPFEPEGSAGLDPDAVHGYTRSAPIELRAGQRLDEVLLRLPAAATIRGRVRLGDGSIPERAHVSVRRIPDGNGNIAYTETTTGEYRLRGLGPGTFELNAGAQAAGLHAIFTRHVTLTEAEELVLDLTLE